MNFYSFKAKCITVALYLMIFNMTAIAQETMGNKFEYRGNARVNTSTNIVAAMYNIKSKIYDGTPDEIARQFLGEHKSDFGITGMSDLKHLEIIKSPAGNHVGFLQTYNGIPIYGSETVVSINKENRVTMVANGNNPIKDLKAIAANISKESAVNKAVTTLNAEEETFVMKPKAELYIYRDSLDNCYLTWKINFIAQKPYGDWQVFVNANTGEILKVTDISEYYVNGTGRVFKPDPITDLQNTALSDQNNTDYQAIQGAYKTVTLNNLNNAVGGVYRLQGRYARSEDIESPSTATVTSATTSFLYNRSQAGFEETNAYYFLDLQRQYVGSLGFSPQWNGQDYIRFDAHGYQGANNSRYVPDGIYVTFGDGDVDGAEDLSVILHEYGHALHDAFMVGTGTFVPPYYDELGISEGISDYLAISYRRTLSLFQQDKVFPWDQNVTDLDFPDSDRWLESTYNFEDNWNGQYNEGTTWASTMMDIEESIGRDITTRLLLTSCSYVTQSSHFIDHIYAIFQADIDLYGGSHLSTLTTIFRNREAFSNTQISGTISSNTTWTGSIFVIGNIQIAGGVTLTISPGAKLRFYNGASLIVNNSATLTANGNSSNPIEFNFISPNSTTQNGIKFNSGSTGTINYCQIRNAYRGIYENSVSVNITNSAISGCTDGIYLYSSSPVIQGCNIHDNSNYGINMMYSSSTIKENYIQNNGTGIYCSSSSQPVIGNNSTQVGNNISSNGNGVIVFNNACPVIGNGSTGGYNNLVNTTYNVLNTTGNTVYAYNNWWGTTNPANFKITGGNVLYTSYRPSAVTIGTPPLSKTGGDEYASESGEIPMLSELDKAYQLAASKNLAEAREVCLNLINNYPDYSVSYNALNMLKETYAENELTAKKDIYKSLFNKKSKKGLYAMAGLILSDIDKENKLKQIDEVIDTYKGESVVELALFNKFVYYYFELDNKENARSISQELDEQFPLSEGTIEAHKILGDEKYFSIGPIRKSNQNSINQTTTEYSLSNNYPNPFNPVTKIQYTIPEISFVTLKVYNVLGREVATLVNENKATGNYEVEFDGRNLASGIYIYKIQAGNFSDTKKFILMK